MGFKLINNAGRSVNILNEDDDVKRRASTHYHSQSLPSLPAPQVATSTTPPTTNNVLYGGPYRQHPYYHPSPYYTHQPQPQPQQQQALPSLPPMTVGGYAPVTANAPMPAAPATSASTPVKAGSSSPSLSAKTASNANNNKGRPVKKYTCHCMRSFTTSGHLARHMRIHTGEKNYVCPQEGCGARFSRQDNCMQHYRTHNGGRGRGANASRTRRKRNTTASPPLSAATSSPAPSSAATPTSASVAGTPQPYYSPQQQYQLPPIQYLSSPPPPSPPVAQMQHQRQDEMQQPQGLPPASMLASAPSSAPQQQKQPSAADNNPLNVFAGVAIMQTVQ